MLPGLRSVDDPFGVGGLDGAGQLLDELGRGERVGFAECPDAVVEGAAGEELHGEVRLAVDVAEFVNLNDVGMFDGGDGFGFGAEADDVDEVGGIGVEEHFEGDDSIESDLLGSVDDAHAAASEFAGEDETGDLGEFDGPH